MSPNFSTRIHKVRKGQPEELDDLLAVEEPLEIRVDHSVDGIRQSLALTVTMRTPGHDEELALGFLLNEGVILEQQDVMAVATCGSADPATGLHNTIKVELAPQVKLDIQRLERHFVANSSCGVCGKTSIEHIQTPAHMERHSSNRLLQESVLRRLPAAMREAQASFGQTGGIHASALFNREGNLLALFEDVGRHNALDKLSGHCWREGRTDLHECILLVSGRLSFELVQKAVMSGFGLVAAIGPPSSLALQLARQFDMTLIGFLHAEHFNVYHGIERLSGMSPADTTP